MQYPFPDKRTSISVSDRAAQFAPFAALTGHDEAVKETARLTDRKIILDEYEKAELDSKLKIIENTAEPILTEIIYFRPDERKSGGEYVTARGYIIKVDIIKKAIIMQDEREISVDDVLSIHSDEFEEN
jgi:hypothetical protein